MVTSDYLIKYTLLLNSFKEYFHLQNNLRINWYVLFGFGYVLQLIATFWDLAFGILLRIILKIE